MATHLKNVWTKACMIGKPAREKETYLAYVAFRALLFGKPSARTASPGKSAHTALFPTESQLPQSKMIKLIV
jgi:hypothetical protein